MTIFKTAFMIQNFIIKNMDNTGAYSILKANVTILKIQEFIRNMEMLEATGRIETVNSAKNTV